MKTVRHYGVPEKVVEVLQSIYSHTSCQVIHNNTHSPALSSALLYSHRLGRQIGCSLSLFN
ncbi:hypothetical protein CHS0354_031027 [Potamilus streckersoni]|uniref:Uncharacterized protein n=1 Tax=Potamilus streckersoni TaxID=2493646 RepID=A0AAE0WB25_9BIVA|nr:hypothetical protein CHS0354_031027 [Potamilus streckersoni]